MKGLISPKLSQNYRESYKNNMTGFRVDIAYFPVRMNFALYGGEQSKN